MRTVATIASFRKSVATGIRWETTTFAAFAAFAGVFENMVT